MASCNICLDNSSNFTTECNHSFCNSCITNWLLQKNSCPMCRKEFYHVSKEELEEIELSNYENEIINPPYLNNDSLFRDFMNIHNRYYLNLSYFPDGIYILCLVGRWIYVLIEEKLPKNINMHVKRKHYRFDNTNFNHIDTRY
jgi:hypothetical protein